MKLRDVHVGGCFRWADGDEPDMIFEVLYGTEPGKDRVDVVAISTGMTIAPKFTYSGDEDVTPLAYCENPDCFQLNEGRPEPALLKVDGTCPKCGISHTHPGCPECGNKGLHKDGCSLTGEFIG